MKKKFLPFLLICILTVFSSIISACDYGKESYDVIAYTWNSRYGLVDKLDGTFKEGTSLTLNARPIVTESAQNSAEFICWIHDNKVTSTESTYTFTLDKNTSGIYYALFTSPEMEFVAMDNFTFTNNIESEDDFAIKNLKISIGENLENMNEVYSMTEDDLTDLTIIKSFDEIYAENYFPFVFDKTKNLYINVTVTYMLGEIEYTSTTEKAIPGVKLNEQFKEITFNLNKATLNNSNVELAGSDTNTFTINFTSLENFELQSNDVIV